MSAYEFGPLTPDEQHDLLSLLHDVFTDEDIDVSGYWDHYVSLTEPFKYTRTWARTAPEVQPK